MFKGILLIVALTTVLSANAFQKPGFQIINYSNCQQLINDGNTLSFSQNTMQKVFRVSNQYLKDSDFREVAVISDRLGMSSGYINPGKDTEVINDLVTEDGNKLNSKIFRFMGTLSTSSNQIPLFMRYRENNIDGNDSFTLLTAFAPQYNDGPHTDFFLAEFMDNNNYAQIGIWTNYSKKTKYAIRILKSCGEGFLKLKADPKIYGFKAKDKFLANFMSFFQGSETNYLNELIKIIMSE